MCHIIDNGVYNDEYAHNWRFIVFKKSGINLREVCRAYSNKFFIEDILKLGIEMIKAVRDLHDLGYVHTNINEGSFYL